MLTDRDRAVLDFAARDLEQRRFGTSAAADEAIVHELGLSAPRYYQLLGRLLERPEAHAYAPMTVSRLRRLRDQREAARSGVA